MPLRHFVAKTMLFMNLSLLALAQQAAARPDFSQFVVKNVWRGTPAAPVLSKDQRSFRTRIREGAKSPVQFAGHYTVPQWGCGAGCSSFVVVDSISGKVYDVSFSLSDLPYAWLEKNPDHQLERIEFRPNSRLMKINGCLNEANCGFYDFEMIDGKGLKLLRKELLPKDVQLE